MSTAILKRLPLLAILALPVPLSGCMSMMVVEAFIKQERNWTDWKNKRDSDIQREVNRLSPPKNCYYSKAKITSDGMRYSQPMKYRGSTWHDYWDCTIQSVIGSGDIETQNKYINYIITERRARGLPEL